MKKIALILGLSVALTGLCACSNKESSSEREEKKESVVFDDSSVVMYVDDDKIRYSDIAFYEYYLKNKYSFFGDELWQYEIPERGSLQQEVSSSLSDYIVEMNIISKEAKSQNIALTDDEREEMYEKADELNASISTEDKEKYSIGVQKIQEIMEENLLAQKLYLSVTDGVGEDISEDDVRVANIEYIKVMTHDTDKNGTAIDLSDADEDAAYKKMQGYKKKIDKGFDFLQLARMSSDSADVKASIYKGYSGLSEGVVNAAMDLKKGEISQIIEDDTGFYLIRCSNNYDEDLSAERKKQMAEELKEESFKKAYGEWSKDVEVMLNDEFWSDFNIVSGDV